VVVTRVRLMGRVMATDEQRLDGLAPGPRREPTGGGEQQQDEGSGASHVQF